MELVLELFEGMEEELGSLAHEACDELSWLAACGEFEADDFILRVEPVRVCCGAAVIELEDEARKVSVYDEGSWGIPVGVVPDDPFWERRLRSW